MSPRVTELQRASVSAAHDGEGRGVWGRGVSHMKFQPQPARVQPFRARSLKLFCWEYEIIAGKKGKVVRREGVRTPVKGRASGRGGEAPGHSFAHFFCISLHSVGKAGQNSSSAVNSPSNQHKQDSLLWVPGVSSKALEPAKWKSKLFWKPRLL